MHKRANLFYLIHNVENKRTVKGYKRTPRIHFRSFISIGNNHSGPSDVNNRVLRDYGIHNSAVINMPDGPFSYINRLKEF